MTEPTVKQALEPLDEAECWQLLGAHAVGRLVVAVGSQPDIFPVNYTLDGETIVVRTAEGTKLAAALMGQLVAFEIDHVDENSHIGWSVVVHGEARESRTLPAVMNDEALDLQPWAEGTKNRYLHISVRTITGRHLVAKDEETR